MNLTPLLAGAVLALPAAAHALCTSDRQPRPAAVLERFINADCADCWREAGPAARAGELALDWIVPGRRGEEAPLATAATRDAPDRLHALRLRPPARSDSARRPMLPAPLSLRVAQGEPFNDYIGTSLELGGGRIGPSRVWLLLVEALPAGAEGSPVPRHLVRNAFIADWDGRRPLVEHRSMRLVEGTRPSRLRLVALVEDARGRVRAIARSECAPEPAQR